MLKSLLKKIEDEKKSEQVKALKALLRKLKERKKSLEAKMESASSKKKVQLKTQLKVIHAQRKKGIKLVKSLKSS
ncbi:hypothetical protein [Magnetofaba australis]|uniref:Uncharacterized protein n=1 Tax=Magnetofaba australis IT-1 TaxID=1434232 RepID=A0A1Y2K1F7_9PROT|nr:hypothetical protein [Magnetofaba australis]OSM01843.1 hypothetical protein MAIT1_01888 [Magnetofaba australis IT-1]